MIAAACHIHSNWSYDAKWPLERIAEEFGRRGFRVLLMSEHDRGFTPDRFAQYREACARASSDRVLLIPGIEYSDASNTIHILVWGVKTFLGENQPTKSLLQAVRAAHGLAVIAHPTRRNAWRQFDPAWSEHLLGVEVWNRKTDGWAPSKTAPRLVKGSSLLPFVGMDFHNHRQIFPLMMELDDVSNVNEESVLERLRAHCCRPMAFGRSLDRVTRGWFGKILHTLEHCRRGLASLFRLLGRARAG